MAIMDLGCDEWELHFGEFIASFVRGRYDGVVDMIKLAMDKCVAYIT
jgi:hypothetical protein